MSRWAITPGALLLAASLFSQNVITPDPELAEGGPQWFSLNETRDQVRAVFGPPKMVADFGPGLQSWQYQIGHVEDHDEFTHVLVFRKSDGALISVARNYAPERNVDAYFPVAATKVYWYRETGQPEYSVRLRRLPGGRVLMAMGTSKPRQTTGQIVLTRESELGLLYPWLARQHVAPAVLPPARGDVF